MNLNIFSHLSSEPFIPHMRIAWQDGIRKQTEKYWRNIIASEVKEQFPYLPNIDIVEKTIRCE